PSCIPFFEEVHEELQATWAIPYSGRAPVPGFAPYMQLHMAKERGYLSFPQVEDAVAGYLSSASPTMRLGQKPLLPTRVGRHQAQLAEKSYLAAGQAACTTNTAALLQRYQAMLLTELASDHTGGSGGAHTASTEISPSLTCENVVQHGTQVLTSTTFICPNSCPRWRSAQTCLCDSPRDAHSAIAPPNFFQNHEGATPDLVCLCSL